MHTHRPYYGDTPSNVRLHSCGNWREVAPSDVAMHHHYYTPGRKCVESSHAHVVVTLRTKMEPTSQWRHPSSTDKGVRLHTPQTALNTGNQSAVAYIAHGVTEGQTPISSRCGNRSQSPHRWPHQQIQMFLFTSIRTPDATTHSKATDLGPPRIGYQGRPRARRRSQRTTATNAKSSSAAQGQQDVHAGIDGIKSTIRARTE